MLKLVYGKVSGQFDFQDKEQRVTFISNGTPSAGGINDLWLLQFSSASSYEDFCQQYREKLFENITGKTFSLAAYEKVSLAACCRPEFPEFLLVMVYGWYGKV